MRLPELHPREIVFPVVDLAAQESLASACALHPAVASILVQRGVHRADEANTFLYPKLSQLSDPRGMADRDLAADRIARAVLHRETIAIFGDYDVDGTTSAAILCEVITALGGVAHPFIADRFAGGYGFSHAALTRVLEPQPSLVITCDCGSSDHERIDDAQKRGVDVVVVDHHLVPDEPLPALAFLNPHRPECPFPFKWLASAGLALVLGAAVREKLERPLDLRQWLDLVALGTVADMAPLVGDNRVMVRAGLQRLGQVDARPGVRMLREYARLHAGHPLSASDISFQMAPRLNAAGRLGDVHSSLRLLLARNEAEARTQAVAVERNNNRRKTLEATASEDALAQVLAVYGEAPSKGIVVASDRWHRGVVGIVAARLVDRFRVPVVVLGIDGASAHGSGRAPHGYRLYDAVASCAELFEKFGGHQAAIGVTIDADRIPVFREAFAASSDSYALPPRSLQVNMVIEPGEALPTLEDLAALEPLGIGNEAPVVALRDAEAGGAKVVGGSHGKFEIRVEGDRYLPTFAPNLGDAVRSIPSRATFLGTLRPDHFRGARAMQMSLIGWMLPQSTPEGELPIDGQPAEG